MNKKDKIWLNLMKFGHFLGCHQMECRSFSVGGYQFPLCARCTGVFVGEIVGIIMLICGFRLEWYIIVPFILLMGADWFVQRINLWESTNVRRFVTGTLCGIALVYCYFYAIVFIIGLFG